MLRFKQRGIPVSEPMEGFSVQMTQLLRNRGIDTPEKAEAFLHPSLTELYDPYQMQDMDKAVALIRRAVQEGVGIQIYGDYDADGVTSTSIMLHVFEKLGVRADFRIPSRHSEGYGLNVQAVKEIADNHGLLITVDCGITNHEEVQAARDLGMTVIVTDHHQLPETPVAADAILNPLCGSYPFRRLCGAGVALKLCQALLGMEGVMECIDLAALGTVADLVPLIDENRVIVHFGMQKMSEKKRPGLDAMIRQAQCILPMTSTQIAFRLGPRINAGGRLEDADQCVYLLTEKDPDKVEDIAAHLEENNRKRQAMQNEITSRAMQEIEEKTDFFDDRCIVVMGENWNTGVIGLAAGRICEKYHFPTIVLSHMEDKAVGSCRSVPGVNIHAMLSRCADLFERFGGHEQAAGLTMKPELVGELRRRLNLLIRENCEASALIPVAEYDMPLELENVTLDFIEQLECMEPTGFGNPAPVFLCRDCHVQQAMSVGKDGAHLKLQLLQKDTLRDAIAFQMGARAGQHLDRVDVIYVPQKNEFRGAVSPQMQVMAMRGAQGTAAVPAGTRIFPALLQEFKYLSSKELTIPEPEERPRNVPRTRVVRRERGTLLIGHSEAQAASLAAEMELDVEVGRVADPRGFNTLLLAPDLAQLQDVWQQIILIDGDVLPGEYAWIRQKCPRAEIHTLKADTFSEELRALRMDTDQLRAIYRSTVMCAGPLDARRVMQELNVTAEQLMLALEAFAEVGLITWTLRPLKVQRIPGVKASPDDSPVLQYVRNAAR